MDYCLLRRLIPKKSEQWTLFDCCKWLQFIRLQKLVPQFQKAKIDGRKLKSITQKNLVNLINIHSKIVCKKLLNWIIFGLQQFDQALQQAIFQDPSPYSSGIETQQNSYMFMNQNCEMNMMKSLKRKQQLDQLIIKRLQQKQNFYYKFCESHCRIGSQINCEIQISGQNIEPYHAKINYRSGAYYLKGLSTEAAVYYRLDNKINIKNGMQIQMGSNVFQITLNQDNKLAVRIIEGRNNSTTFMFDKNCNKIQVGRKNSNQISFSDDITLSNLHARFSLCKQNWYLQDIATTNGTWIKIQKQFMIYSGLVFKLGLTNIQFQCQLRKTKNNALDHNIQNSEQLSLIYVQKQNENCKMCNQNIRNILYLPCHHCQVCEFCIPNINKCQLCNNDINGSVKIFKA